LGYTNQKGYGVGKFPTFHKNPFAQQHKNGDANKGKNCYIGCPERILDKILEEKAKNRCRYGCYDNLEEKCVTEPLVPDVDKPLNAYVEELPSVNE